MTSDAERQKRRTNFYVKNQRRRLFYDSSNPAHRRARQLRRECGGAFGKNPDLAVGTSMDPNQ